MADTALTGATADVTVDNAKTIIKWVLIVVVAVVLFWVVKKYVLKK